MGSLGVDSASNSPAISHSNESDYQSEDSPPSDQLADNLVSDNTTTSRIGGHNGRNMERRGESTVVERVDTLAIANEIHSLAASDPQVASDVLASIDDKIAPADMSQLHEGVRQAQMFEAAAYQNLASGGIEGSVVVDEQQALTRAEQMIISATETVYSSRGRSQEDQLDTNELAYQLERLSQTSPADAVATRMVMDNRLDAQQLGELNKALGNGRSWTQEIDLALSHPGQGLIGAGKGIVNGFSALAEIVAQGSAYQAAGNQYNAAALQSLYDTDRAEQTIAMAEQMHEAAGNIDVPEFSIDNGAQAGGEILGFAVDVAFAGKGLVTGGARVLLSKGDELAEVVVRQTDELAGAVNRTGVVTRATDTVLDIPQGLSSQQFDDVSGVLRNVAADRGLGTDIVIQGSRADGTAGAASDIDIAIRMSPQQFDKFIETPAQSRLASPSPGSAAARTRDHAITTGKVQSGEARLSGVRRELEAALGMDVDLSIVKVGGMFDNGPQLPIR